MAKKYQVFISSTFDDLKEHRDAVVKAVLQLGHLPVGMEMFNAGDQTQWETIKSYIDSSDYYLVVLAHRYGSKDPKSRISYTEKEYDYAGKQKIPRLGFVIDKAAAWPANYIEADAKKELDAFKSKVGKARVIKFWDTIDKLAYHVSLSLSNEITINPRIGWVRATEAASPQVAEELARLSKENNELLEKIKQVQPPDEYSIILALLEEQTIEIPAKGELVPVSLRDVFLAACSKQDRAFTHIIHNAIRAANGSPFINQTATDKMEITKEALEELARLGLFNVDRGPKGSGQIESWHLSGKGQQLYIKLRQVGIASIS
ncbi:MAG TPA: DUF4062 domain-containing protein [Hymenobacter sp.]|jgi:hypothetical protein|uniref:DUF4062 domain-containing protein n=1 Tax=Hymenobacter sp. TaxID=1898978 RepID=UPI002ED7E49C